MLSLMLYVTEHCQLCDAAFTALANSPEMAGHRLQVIDFGALDDLDDDLLDRLGPHIPWLSLLNPTTLLTAARQQQPLAAGVMLSWPFSADELAAWLVTADASEPGTEG